MKLLNINDTINIRGREYKVVRNDNLNRCIHCPFKEEGKELCNMYLNLFIDQTEYSRKPCRILLGGGRLEPISSLGKWKDIIDRR